MMDGWGREEGKKRKIVKEKSAVGERKKVVGEEKGVQYEEWQRCSLSGLASERGGGGEGEVDPEGSERTKQSQSFAHTNRSDNRAFGGERGEGGLWDGRSVCPGGMTHPSLSSPKNSRHSFRQRRAAGN